MKISTTAVICMAAASLLLTACGGGDDEESLAQYRGTTLIVRGQAYERDPDLQACGRSICEDGTPRYIARELIIAFKSGREAEGSALLQDMSLQESARGNLRFAEVPLLFEAQWQAALSREDVVEVVELNLVLVPGSLRQGLPVRR